MIREKESKISYTPATGSESAVIGRMAEMYGTSADTKPTTGIVNGSTFTEVDTGDLYYFNEDNSTWVKKNESGGGGSSDFSTAQVTLISSNAIGIECYLPTAISVGSVSAAIFEVSASVSGSTYSAILYKGNAMFMCSGHTLSSEDSTCIIDEDTATISGDCTITIS